MSDDSDGGKEMAAAALSKLRSTRIPRASRRAQKPVHVQVTQLSEEEIPDEPPWLKKRKERSGWRRRFSQACDAEESGVNEEEKEEEQGEEGDTEEEENREEEESEEEETEEEENGDGDGFIDDGEDNDNEEEENVDADYKEDEEEDENEEDDDKLDDDKEEQEDDDDDALDDDKEGDDDDDDDGDVDKKDGEDFDKEGRVDDDDEEEEEEVFVSPRSSKGKKSVASGKKRRVGSRFGSRVAKKRRSETTVRKKKRGGKIHATKKAVIKKMKTEVDGLRRQTTSTFACELDNVKIEMKCPWLVGDEFFQNSSTVLKKMMESHVNMVQAKEGKEGLLGALKEKFRNVQKKVSSKGKSCSNTSEFASKKRDDEDGDEVLDEDDDVVEEGISVSGDDIPFLLFQAFASYIELLKQQGMKDRIFSVTRMFKDHWSSSFEVMTKGKRLGSAAHNKAKKAHATMVVCKELKAMMQPVLSEIVYDFCKVCFCVWFFIVVFSSFLFLSSSNPK